MELWIPITIAAAFLQNIRSALQRHLKDRLGVSGTTLVRFLYGVPTAIAIVAVLHFGFGMALPLLNAAFAFWVMVAASCQIVAQALLIAAFSHRNFTVASAYSRTEPVHAALFGFLVLGDTVTLFDGVAIALAVAGVALISVARDTLTFRNLGKALLSRGALLGLASGAVFGLTAVAYRTASLSLDGPGFLMQASVTLLAAILFQTIALAVFMAWRNQAELAAVIANWRIGALVGTVGAVASFGWFAAMTLQQAAVVKALAQVEMLFTYAATLLVFRENVNGRELFGCLLIIAGILALLYG
jgi:drug/metabolite transporter (DMT)-like permease